MVTFLPHLPNRNIYHLILFLVIVYFPLVLNRKSFLFLIRLWYCCESSKLFGFFLWTFKHLFTMNISPTSLFSTNLIFIKVALRKNISTKNVFRWILVSLQTFINCNFWTVTYFDENLIYFMDVYAIVAIYRPLLE